MENQALYEKYKKGEDWNNHLTIYAQQFSAFLKKHGFSGLLIDIGCGNGKDVNLFHKNGFDAIGIDYSEDEVSRARLFYPDCNFEKQDSESIAFENESVGAFFMINVIHYLNKKKALKEIYRTLRKGGFVFIHFNISITDNEGIVDYEHGEDDIMKVVSDFRIIKKRVFERTDGIPIRHSHKIMELILQKW